jgi:STE24 endopeptidase
LSIVQETALDHRGRRYRQWQQAGTVVAAFGLYGIVVAWTWTGYEQRFDASFGTQPSFAFTALAALAIALSLSVPYICFQAYALVVEKRFSFLRLGFAASLVRVARAAAYTVVVLWLAISFVCWSFLLAPHLWWLIVPIGLLVWRVVQSNLYPQWLSLFHDVRPLTEPSLLQHLAGLEERAQLLVRSYHVVHLKGITSKANAWVSGMLGRHNVLLTDTLLENHSCAEIASVVAHEFGHVKHRDVLKRLSLISLFEAGGLWLLHWADSGLLDLHVDSLAEIAQLTFWTGAIAFYSRLLIIRFARRQEERADEFALANSDPAAFSSAMQKLKEMNLITYDKKEEARFSHPAMDERIRKADELARKQAAAAED